MRPLPGPDSLLLALTAAHLLQGCLIGVPYCLLTACGRCQQPGLSSPMHLPAAGAGPPHKVGERVTRVTPVAKPPIEAMLASLNLGVQNSIDPDPENLVAVGTFTYTPQGQQPQQVGRGGLSTQRHAHIVCVAIPQGAVHHVACAFCSPPYCWCRWLAWCGLRWRKRSICNSRSLWPAQSQPPPLD